MPYKDPQKRLENLRKWKLKNAEKVKAYYEKAKIKKRKYLGKAVKTSCATCNKEFIKEKHNNKYCSLECKPKRQWEKIPIHLQKKKGQPKKYHSEEEKRLAQKLAHKKYRQTDKYKETYRKYLENEEAQLKRKKYRSSSEFKKMMAKKESEFRKTEKGKEIKRRYERKRWKSDPLVRMKHSVRSRLLIFLKNKGYKKPDKINNLLGCSWITLKKHLESQFKKGMSWDNHDIDGWHIDHIVPLSKAKNADDIYKLMNYKNLQPLWAAENIKKSNKI